ncbi:MAG: High-affinity Fe2+/Pb2+ permease [Gammaproteobacteria bacterium]|nr:High-affinity Fe2+/Pb2+ permease [Gammaproteobacteria bacterium]
MTAAQWGGGSAIFLASAVEWVEAFTIVLAVALTIGWRRASGAALAALGVVAILIAATGAGLRAAQADIGAIRAAIGVFLLLFGLRWYVKAIRRYCGRTALHDEAREFADTREHLEHAEGRAAWAMAFKGVLLEGLEVWLLVVALGHTLSYAAAAGSAAASLAVVIVLGLALKAPLTRVPENTLKYVVACAILSFGSFWSIGGLAGERAVWPLGDATLLLLFAAYAAAGRAIAWRSRVAGAAAAGAQA